MIESSDCAGSSDKFLEGKRLVVCGDAPLRHALYNSLAQVVNRSRLDLASDEEEARECLWMAGDSPQLSDATHLILVSSSQLTAERLFRVHCRCRPNARQDATLNGFGPGWSGGILFIGPNKQDFKQLVEMEPFHRVRAGHEVLASSASLLNVVVAVSNLKPIYPEKWKAVLLSIKGFSGLRSALQKISKKPARSRDDLKTLLDELDGLLADDLLGKLLAHREVIRKLREIVGAVREHLAKDCQDYSDKYTNAIRTVLADYL